MEQRRLTLDNDAFRGRVRGYSSRPVVARPRVANEFVRTRKLQVQQVSDLKDAQQTSPSNITHSKDSTKNHTVSAAPPLSVSKTYVADGATVRSHLGKRPSEPLAQSPDGSVFLHKSRPATSGSMSDVKIPAKSTSTHTPQKLRISQRQRAAAPSVSAHKPVTSVRPIAASTKAKPKSKRKYLTAALAGVSILIGLGLWGLTLKNNHEVVAQIQEIQEVKSAVTADDGGVAGSEASIADYDEQEPKIAVPYSVAPDLPKYVIIEKLGVKSRVKRVGVDANNVMQTPKNIFDSGWYDASAKPGEVGAVFINGHVSGPTKKGVFYKLKELNNGDVITIEKGDGSHLRYVVAASESFRADSVDMTKALRPYGNATEGLTLMTCGGAFDKASQSYQERRVVYAFRQP